MHIITIKWKTFNIWIKYKCFCFPNNFSISFIISYIMCFTSFIRITFLTIFIVT